MDASTFFPQHEVHVGKDLGGRAVAVDQATIARYEAGTGGPAAGLQVDGARVAPALLYHSEVYRSLSWYLPNVFGNLHARQEWELYAPLVVGRTVRTRSTVVERYAKRDRDYVVNEVLITDEDGRWLQRSRTHQSFLAAERHGAIVVDRDREKRPDRRFTIGEGPGEEVAPLERTITHVMCVAFSGPEKNYHTDEEMARALGFPDIVVQGMLSVCFVAELMAHAFGIGWHLAGKLDVRLVNVVWPRDVLVTRGKVRDELPEGSRRRTVLDVWCEKPDGTKTVVGTASALR
ncbi:MAG TPA: MaoC/PaaZ C-terminal domain-containing protein [Candidatus Binatia bacterium]|jgi:acyl dehydratase